MCKRFIVSYDVPIVDVGGGETLTLRMSQFFSQFGYKPYVMFPYRVISDDTITDFFERNNISVISNRDMEFFSEDDDLIFIAYQIRSYIMGIVEIAKNHFINVKAFIYVISPILDRRMLINDNLFKTKYKAFYKMMCKNKSIFFYCDYEKKSHNILMEEDENTGFVLHVPIKVEILSHELKKKQDNKFIVLSACRMEFPFKQYVLGLVKDYIDIMHECSRMELWIVGAGRDYRKLQDTISALEPSIQNKIKLYGALDYDELKYLYKEASVYVGMGTTVLEAAQQGVISICASGFQDVDYCSGFFDETGEIYYALNEPNGIIIDDAKKYHIKDLLLYVYGMTKEEYKKKSLASYYMLKEKFDMNNILNVFLDGNYKNSYDKYYNKEFRDLKEIIMEYGLVQEL